MTSQARIDPSVREGSAIDAAILVFCETVERACSVDLMTSEIVRLRCAEYHNCRICGSFRNVQALAQGLDETLVQKIRDHAASDLPERWKVALRLADAVMAAPREADAQLSADLHEHFSDEQIAEIIFDVMKWSDQKVEVSLATDSPPWEGLSLHTFDEQGRMRSHGPISAEPAIAR